jgi:hypothetical protein
MVAAWLLVALGEWVAARNAAREYELVYGVTAPPGVPDDPRWFDTAEDTALDAPDERTATRLPPPQPD